MRRVTLKWSGLVVVLVHRDKPPRMHDCFTSSAWELVRDGREIHPCSGLLFLYRPPIMGGREG